MATTSITTSSPTPATAHRASGAGQVALAVARIGLGFVFLWAFLDKMFGLGYGTGSAKSVLNGGSPSKGFLSHVNVGPLQSFFHSIAGVGIVDWIFMISLLGIGVAMILGAGLRIAAVSSVVLLLGMWAAEWPMAQFAADGTASGSQNPFVDYHIVYALLAVVLGFFATGSRLGLGHWWSTLGVVRKHPVLV
ncbi:DoxX family protein [Lapillicoccus sp.]|uniref:DoxX family protein n=1 Tax=Lapillicoccus sp. TaxID=1909287 RepID=UPI0027BDDD3B|nr:hypothetical protein [Actinomycetota bacterium]